MERLTTRIVGPDGPLDARICLIGQAPGAEEDKRGLPFKGRAGRLLDQRLRVAGIARATVLINNVFKQRPPNNDVHYFFEDKSNTRPTWEGQEHIDMLRTWLEGLLDRRRRTGEGPNVIGALGREAMMVLTGHKRIEKWRGSVLPCTLVEGLKVYPTYHPSFINRLMNEPEEKLLGRKKQQQQNALPLFDLDLKRIEMQSEFPDIRYPEREFLILDNVPDIVGYLHSLHNEEMVAVDIETLRGENGPIVWCIGFAKSPYEAMCIPIIRRFKLHWTAKEEMEIWKAVSELFLNPKVHKIFQGGSYDTSILARYYGLRCAPGSYEDTMLYHQSTYPDLRKGLDLLTSVYTWEPYYKDDGKVWDGRRISDQAEFEYNSKDCCVTREIFPVIKRDAFELRTQKTYENTIKVFPSILYMQVRGVRIDVKKKRELSVRFKEEADKAHNTIQLLAEKAVNPDSPTQVSRLLYSDLELPIQYGHKTKRPSTDKDAINNLLRITKGRDRPHKIVQALQDYKKFGKLVSTYTTMEVDSDGRIHTSYSWISTFRLNSSESHFGGGGNLQNIPVRTGEGREIRKLFIPDPGLVFLAADLAQAEAREVAWDARDSRLIEYFMTPGFDVHWLRAKETFAIPKEIPYNPKALFRSKYLEEEKPLKFYRDIGKTIVHAFNYKMGPQMLQNILIREEVYIPQRTCKFLLESTRRNNPMTVAWQNNIIEQIRATRTLQTPLGDVRTFRGRQSDSLWRSAIAFKPQSTVGRIVQLGINELYSTCSLYEPLLNVHDEVVGQCKKEDIECNMVDIRNAMEIPHMVGGRELTIPCDFKTGPNWGELEEIK